MQHRQQHRRCKQAGHGWGAPHKRHSQRKAEHNILYSAETGEFSSLTTRELMFDDIFTRTEFLKPSEINIHDENEFTDMSQ